MTKTGSKVGTVYYMSPEQVKGQEVTNRSDIYSIGCTAFEMIVGQPPFDFPSEYEVMDSHLKKNPPRISEKIGGAPEQIDKVILKALEKNPLNRYASCDEMLQDVQELDHFVAKLYTGYFRRPEPRSKKYKILAVSAFAGVALLLIGLSYFVYKQVNTLITTNQLDKFRKYSIQQLFSASEPKYKFTQINKVETGVLQNLNAAFILNQQFEAAVGDSGTIIISNDDGKTWINKQKSFRGKFNDIYVNRDKNAFIVGDSSTLFIGSNNLDSLTSIPMEKGYTFFRIIFRDDKIGFITGNKGLILKTVNGGINWNKVSTKTNQIIFDIAFFDATRGLATGWNGLLLTTTDGGNNWTPNEQSLTDNYLKSVDVTSSGYGILTGGDGTIFFTRDYGKSWDKIETKMTNGFQKVKYINDDNVLIVGSQGSLLVSKDKGETWSLVDSQIFSNMNDIAVDAFGKIYIVGVNGMMFKIF
jgi:photosystem II stability/assembly factor-like uncharacterized protein